MQRVSTTLAQVHYEFTFAFRILAEHLRLSLQECALTNWLSVLTCAQETSFINSECNNFCIGKAEFIEKYRLMARFVSRQED